MLHLYLHISCPHRSSCYRSSVRSHSYEALYLLVFSLHLQTGLCEHHSLLKNIIKSSTVHNTDIMYSRFYFFILVALARLAFSAEDLPFVHHPSYTTTVADDSRETWYIGDKKTIKWLDTLYETEPVTITLFQTLGNSDDGFGEDEVIENRSIVLVSVSRSPYDSVSVPAVDWFSKACWNQVQQLHHGR